MVLDTAWYDEASRYDERRRLFVLRGERRDGERSVSICIACERSSVCAVFVSSSLVSSDGALAIGGVGDLDSQTERMANSE